MEDYDQFKKEFDTCFKTLEKLTTDSFSLMEDDPKKRDEIISLWKDYILVFKSFTFKTGEKYNNRDVFKTITKALMFGK